MRPAAVGYLEPTVAYKDLKRDTADLKPIYKAATGEGALLELDRFEEMWGEKYPLIKIVRSSLVMRREKEASARKIGFDR